MPNKVLFLLKKNSEYGYSTTSKSGLLNSATLLAQALRDELGLDVEIEICVDGNEVDKFVHKHKPKFVIIEALWVTPEKMAELSNLWKNVDFVIRVHSKIPFLANEGNAVAWIKGYLNQKLVPAQNVFVGFNNRDTYNDFLNIGIPSMYLPNIYPIQCAEEEDKSLITAFKNILPIKNKQETQDCDVLHVACAGAIRPMKSQLLQAFAAMRYCEEKNLILNFYINASRIEQRGQQILDNIRALFAGSNHKLIELPWMTHEEFKKIIATMDVGLQVSLSESFNVVSADFVDVGVPIVVSPDINWLPEQCIASPSDISDIVLKMEHVLNHSRKIVYESRIALIKHNRKSLYDYMFLKS